MTSDDTFLNAITECVEDELISHGLYPRYVGFEPLRDCAALCAVESWRIGNVQKNLYPAVAEKHGTTVTQIYRSMRYCSKLLSKSLGDSRLTSQISIIAYLAKRRWRDGK